MSVYAHLYMCMHAYMETHTYEYMHTYIVIISQHLLSTDPVPCIVSDVPQISIFLILSEPSNTTKSALLLSPYYEETDSGLNNLPKCHSGDESGTKSCLMPKAGMWLGYLPVCIHALTPSTTQMLLELANLCEQKEAVLWGLAIGMANGGLFSVRLLITEILQRRRAGGEAEKNEAVRHNMEKLEMREVTPVRWCDAAACLSPLTWPLPPPWNH